MVHESQDWMRERIGVRIEKIHHLGKVSGRSKTERSGNYCGSGKTRDKFACSDCGGGPQDPNNNQARAVGPPSLIAVDAISTLNDARGVNCHD
jgi:hypothetical protein